MKTRILTVGILAVALAVGLLAPATAQSPVSEFDTILADRVIVTADTSAPDVAASDDLTVGDDATIGGDAAVTGALTAGTAAITGAATAGSLSTTGNMAAGSLNLVEGADLTVTNGGTVTTTASLHALTSTGNVWTDSITGGTNGRVVVLYNSAATTITISDTGNLKLSGNIALGQTDTLTLLYRNPNWYQLATTNN